MLLKGLNKLMEEKVASMWHNKHSTNIFIPSIWLIICISQLYFYIPYVSWEFIIQGLRWIWEPFSSSYYENSSEFTYFYEIVTNSLLCNM